MSTFRALLVAAAFAAIVVAGWGLPNRAIHEAFHHHRRLQHDKKAQDWPVTVPSLNVTQYLGLWYNVFADLLVISTFQNNSFCATATYGPVDPVTGHIGVLNFERLYSTDGPAKSITGYAFQPNPQNPGQLSVFLDGAGTFDAPYWILALGPVVNDQYQYAIVSDEFRLTLFILCRNVTDFQMNYQDEVLNLAQSLGFENLNGPIPIEQNNCTYA